MYVRTEAYLPLYGAVWTCSCCLGSNASCCALKSMQRDLKLADKTQIKFYELR